MHYTLKHLRYIEAADRHQSITSAAEALAVSPSSIASAIDLIEEQLNQPLFDRVPSRGIVASPYGRQFLLEVRQFLSAQSRFDHSLQELGRDLDGSARIACFTSLAPILLPLILTKVRERYPKLRIDLMEGTVDEIVRALDDGEADFGICYSQVPDMAYKFTPLFTAYPHAALCVSHPLASGRSVSLEQLAPEPLVMLDIEPSRLYALGLFTSRGLKPNVVYSSRNTDMMRALVAAGMGYAIFNIRPMIKQSYATGDMVRLPLTGEHHAPQAGVLTRRDAQISPICQAIIASCEMLALSGSFDTAVIPPYVPLVF